MNVLRTLYGFCQGILMIAMLHVSLSLICLNPYTGHYYTANHFQADTADNPIGHYLLPFSEEAVESQECYQRSFLLLFEYTGGEVINPIRNIRLMDWIRGYHEPLTIVPDLLQFNCVLII